MIGVNAETSTGMGAIGRMQVVVRYERVSHLYRCTPERQSLCESHRQRRWLTCWSYAKKINNCPSLLSVYRHFSARLLCKRNVRLVTFSLMFPVLIRHATVTTMKVEGMCVYIVPPTSGKTCSICISFLVF